MQMMYSQPAIYFATDPKYGMSSNPNADGSKNAAALQLAIDAAESQGGGIIVIPSDDSISGGNKNIYNMATQPGKSYAVAISGSFPLLITGTGGATELKMTVSGDLFDTSGFTGPALGFEDLVLSYKQPRAPSGLTGTALNLVGCKNVSVRRVYFDDCQFPIVMTNVTAALVLQCTCDYTGNYPLQQPATAITVAGNSSGVSGNIDIDSCVCRVNSSNVPTGSIGILVTGANGLRVMNGYLSGFQAAGIKIAPAAGMSCENLAFTRVRSESPTYAILLQPQTGAPISNVRFSSCDVQYGGTPGAAVGVYFNTSDNSLIDTVLLENCDCTLNTTYGVQIAGGQHILIVGGVYASNGTAGIAITGAANEVLVEAVSLTGPSYSNPTGTQQYGVLAQGGATNVLIRSCQLTQNSQAALWASGQGTQVRMQDCDASGNSTYGVVVSNNCAGVYVDRCNLSGYASGSAVNVSSPGNLQVTNCPGYNDQGTILASQIPASRANFNGVTYMYFGPVTFYTTPGTSTVNAVTIAGAQMPVISGTFDLGPPVPGGGPFAAINWVQHGAQSPTFLMIGQ